MTRTWRRADHHVVGLKSRDQIGIVGVLQAATGAMKTPKISPTVWFGDHQKLSVPPSTNSIAMNTDLRRCRVMDDEDVRMRQLRDACASRSRRSCHPATHTAATLDAQQLDSSFRSRSGSNAPVNVAHGAVSKPTQDE